MDDTLIDITVNGEARQIASGTSVADATATLDDAPAAFATAVNGEFIARSARAERTLQAGDALFLFQPITGG
ncbi:MAG: sulfur carrier protein ThiS [Burkholderiales bacterium]